MKTLFKFTLLSALIISGKLAKQSAPAPVTTQATTSNPIVLVHQVLTSEPVQPAQQPLSGSGLLAELF